jgi:hypothetical protein
MELIIFTTSIYFVLNQYYYFLCIFLLSNLIFDWTIESNDEIFKDKFALTIKNTCLKINNYRQKILNIKIYIYLNNKFLIFVQIIKKALINKIEKVYITNVNNNYEKMLMSCFDNFSNIIEPKNKLKNRKIDNVDEKIQKYISAFKKPN